MIRTKGKRKIVYNEKVFYWSVSADNEGIFKIYILSEDKHTQLEFPLFDSEVPVTPAYIKHLLDKHFEE